MLYQQDQKSYAVPINTSDQSSSNLMFSDSQLEKSNMNQRSKAVVAGRNTRMPDLTKDFNPITAGDESDQTQTGDIFLDNISALTAQNDPQDTNTKVVPTMQQKESQKAGQQISPRKFMTSS